MCVFLCFRTSPAQTVGPMALIFCMGIGNLGLKDRFSVNQGQRSRVKVRKVEKCVFLSHFSQQEASLGQVGIGEGQVGYYWQLANFFWQLAKIDQIT